MGIKGIIKFFAHRALEVSVIIAILILLPNLPPHAPYSESYRLVPHKPLTGKLAINDKLNDLEIWHKGDFQGPETITDHEGVLYTSLLGGDVVKLVGKDHVVPVVKFGKPCGEYYEEKQCGRPLGLRFGKDGMLYVADCYYGLWKVDTKTGKKELLVSPDEEINGIVPKIFNSLAVAANGDIYFSHSSSYFDLQNGVFDFLADPSGRLIRYDPKTKTKTVLIDKLGFANGVVLSDDEEFVLVSESAKSRILRYYLKGPKKGTYDVFIDGLPGLPDNLDSDGKDGFLVPLVIAADNDHPMATQFLAPFPSIRKLLSRLLGIADWLFETIDRYYPNEIAKKAAFYIGHFTALPRFMENKRVTLLRVSKNGEIIDSLHTMNKKVGHLCDAHIFKDTLYMGSFRNDYIAKIPLSKIGWDDLRTDTREKRETKPVVKEKQVPVETPKIEVTTPPPAKKVVTEKPAPPPKQEAPVKQTTPPPKKETVTPKPVQQQTQPPKKVPEPTKTPPPPPKKEAPPQKTQTPPPKRQEAQKQVPLPKQQTPPPKQDAAKEAPPPKHEAAKQAPPPKQQTPPPKQEAPKPTQAPKVTPKQADKQVPSPQTTTQPPKQPEAQKQAPPTKTQTQPSRQAPTTPPPVKQATPQNQQGTPPKQAPPTAQPAKEKVNQAPVKDGSKKEL